MEVRVVVLSHKETKVAHGNAEGETRSAKALFRASFPPSTVLTGGVAYNPNARPLQRVRFSLLCQSDLSLPEPQT